MRSEKWIVAGAVGLALAIGAAGAHAFVIAPKTDAAKHRGDVAKQTSKYVACVTKAALKCEKKGSLSSVECNTATLVVDGTVAAKAASKFPGDIAKCASKVDLGKKAKTSDYVQIGCPGDCDDVAPGIQECGDIAGFQASVLGNGPSSIRGQLPTLGAALDAFCGLELGQPSGSSAAMIACTADNAKVLGKIAKGYFKCQQKCETDYQDKKGDGGPNDSDNCLIGLSSKAEFNGCISKVESKTVPKLSFAGTTLLPVVASAINTATDGLFNRFDPTDPTAPPCGTCGDNVREGVEECDGTDDAACVGACNTNCTCP